MTVRFRILLMFLLTLAGGFFALERWLSLELRPRYYQSFEEPLVDMTNVLAEIAGPEFDHPRPDFGRLQAGCRPPWTVLICAIRRRIFTACRSTKSISAST